MIIIRSSCFFFKVKHFSCDYFQLPACHLAWGHCLRCDPTDKSYHYELRGDPSRHLSHFTQHVLHANHREHITCQNCDGKRFHGQREFQQHFCERFKLSHPNPSEYTLKTLDSNFGATIVELKEHQQYRILFETKSCLPGLWPTVNVTSAIRRYSWKDFANPNGISFLKKVLSGLRELPPPKNMVPEHLSKP